MSESTLAALRRFLLVILILALLGTGAELLLVGHYEDPWQWAPLALIALSLVVLAWHAIARRAATVRVLQAVMLLCLISGPTGLVLHWRAKMEFKRESNPSLTGVSLFWQSLHSESPPALAPGIMVQMALLGLAYTYRHPALAAPKSSSTTKGA